MQDAEPTDSVSSAAREPEEVQLGRSVARQKNLPLWIAWLTVALVLLAAIGLATAAGLIRQRASRNVLQNVLWQDKTCTVRPDTLQVCRSHLYQCCAMKSGGPCLL